MKMKKILLGVAAGVLTAHASQAFAPTNFFAPQDTLVRFKRVKGSQVRLGAYMEAGSRTNGSNWNAHKRNVLALHDDLQLSAHMLLNPVTHNPTAVFAEASLGYRIALRDVPGVGGAAAGMIPIAGFDPINANKERGIAAFEGNFSGYGMTLHAGANLPFVKVPGRWSAELYLPVASRRVRNVKLVNKTREVAAVGGDRAAYIFNQNLAANMQQYFGQNLTATDVNGVGDVAAFVNWHYGHKIKERYLRKLCFFARLGVTAPTGVESHTEKPFRMALGNDGAWGMPFSLGVKAAFLKKLHAGVAFDGLVLANETKLRRVKTSKLQSEFMLINRARMQKDHGFTFQLSPYLELYQFGNGLSLKLAYQYTRHNADKLIFKDDAFRSVLANFLTAGGLPRFRQAGDTPENVVNSANSLKRWDVHNMILQLNWDLARNAENAPGAPQISLFYKCPMSARNMIDTNTVGGQLTFNF